MQRECTSPSYANRQCFPHSSSSPLDQPLLDSNVYCDQTVIPGPPQALSHLSVMRLPGLLLVKSFPFSMWNSVFLADPLHSYCFPWRTSTIGSQKLCFFFVCPSPWTYSQASIIEVILVSYLCPPTNILFNYFIKTALLWIRLPMQFKGEYCSWLFSMFLLQWSSFKRLQALEYYLPSNMEWLLGFWSKDHTWLLRWGHRILILGRPIPHETIKTTMKV